MLCFCCILSFVVFGIWFWVWAGLVVVVIGLGLVFGWISAITHSLLLQLFGCLVCLFGVGWVGWLVGFRFGVVLWVLCCLEFGFGFLDDCCLGLG